MEPEKWLIWSNEHNAWWAPNHRGYTQAYEEAGVYNYKEALGIVEQANIYQDKTKVPYIPNETMVPLISA